MVDLRDEGPVSVLFLRIDPTKDCEENRRPDGDVHLSFDRRVLDAVLGQEHGVVQKGRKGIDFSQIDIARILAVEPIGNCVLAVYWQTPEQASQNPDVGEIGSTCPHCGYTVNHLDGVLH